MHHQDISINEWEALAFFGREPVSRAFGEAWWDSDPVYKITDKSGLTLTCALHPIHHDVHLMLSLGDHVIYDWEAQDLEDVCYVEESDRTVVRFVLNSRNTITLQLEPSILIKHFTLPTEQGT